MPAPRWSGHWHELLRPLAREVHLRLLSIERGSREVGQEDEPAAVERAVEDDERRSGDGRSKTKDEVGEIGGLRKWPPRRLRMLKMKLCAMSFDTSSRWSCPTGWA